MISQRFKSSAVISLMAAIAISGSFCLHILTMTVTAAGFSNQPDVAEMPMAQVMSTAPSCCQDCDNYSSVSSLNPGSGGNRLSCCSGQTIKPTITSASPDVLNHIMTVSRLAVTASIINNPVGSHYYQATILSPPQTVALRSIVKLE